ncbi:kinase domain-containing protein [Favolaschia claudopus]|uniref:non-specific serine/threonine protein kinase n=1 Tax=Favolaschia claudopus TaxID=2862362 RepID=A0AAW0EHH5_9AGAR
MAHQPGTLVPGQSISVNKYTVQVERYLSQGSLLRGFAHVYLVRTATPVYNTTHHVLKRIAVANDAMLTEVKKEVDIMRLLKGHPNIVHLIDAAWHRMPNGLYEVFILMEFCPGGGIIDMMNRRLRERLTEAEILQIFVDVCEGVAYMHNSRPPLLHRDLKVENILQSSATSFKLCDFGSATTVSPRPPSTVQEIRALEADLNRHTTLQYRAPEMVDPYLRRPVDEKSDIWALGVLLYKLCYYTTPFEEHGPLAILNVQYRIPPYPVYSQQMNSLIASMLREHGAQRPSVFELLSISQFTYTIPAPQPLSPRPQQTFAHTVVYRSQQQQQVSPAKGAAGAGVQARDKVLEAIAPMPSPSRSRNASPQKERPLPQQPPPQSTSKNWLEEEDKAWNAVSAKSGTSAPKRSALDDDAWATRGAGSNGNTAAASNKGFGDDFAEKLWDSFDPNSSNSATNGKRASVSSSPAPASKANNSAVPTPPPLRPPAFTGSFASQRTNKDKDAFEGLGSFGGSDKPAPTLGEARLLRTGLAGMSGMMSSSTSNKYEGISGDYRDYKPGRPSPSPKPSYNAQSSATTSQVQAQAQQTLSPNPPPLQPSSSGSSWLSHAPLSMSRPGSSGLADKDQDAAESRFPSLEELESDANFGPPLPGPGAGHASRSQPVLPPPRKESASASASSGGYGGRGTPGSSSQRVENPNTISRPALTRKHRSSVTMKHSYAASSSSEDGSPTMPRGVMAGLSAAGVSGALESSSAEKRDWLTGSDEEIRMPQAFVSSSHSQHSRIATTSAIPSRSYGVGMQNSFGGGADYSSSGMEHYKSPPNSEPHKSSPTPVMRQSPGKRTSVIEKAPLHISEGLTVQRDHVREQLPPSPNTPSSPTTRAARVFPALDMGDERGEREWGKSKEDGLRGKEKQKEMESASSADEGPEDANGFRSTPMNRGAKSTTQEVGRPKRKGRQSSVHDLVDLYGGAGVLSLPSPTPKEKDRISPSLLDDLTPRKTTFGVGVGMPSTQQAKAPTPTPVESKAKRRSTALASVSTSHAPSSSTTALSPPNSGRPQPGSPRGGKATTPTSASSSSGRSPRPQSMFLFPSSKPSESVAASNLSPPEDPKPRSHMRRTSISDMVQRYEAIGGSTKSPGSTAASPISPPMLPSKSTPIGFAAPRAENGTRFTSVSTQSTASSSAGVTNSRSTNTTPLPVPSAGLGDPSKGYSSGLPPRVSPTGLPRTTTPLQQQQQREPEIAAPRARRMSYKSVDLMGGSSSGPPSRKTTMDSAAEPSPSPERPYQGVGKLIDQWQRKTAESDNTAGAGRGGGGKRGGGGGSGGLVAKRAGLVGKGI